MEIEGIQDIGRRVERKKEQTKQKILEVTMRLIATQGFEATSMEQIAQEADIAKGTLYNYYPVKEAILSHYMRQAFAVKDAQRMLDIQRLPDTRSRMIFVLSELMEGVQRQKEIFEKYLLYEMQKMISLRKEDGVQSGFAELARAIMVLGQKENEVRSDLPLNILVGLLEFSLIKVAQQFYENPEHFNARQSIEYCVDLCLTGAKYQKGVKKDVKF